MKTVLLNEEYRCKDACVLALGFFDGVHAGHKKILSAAVDRARSAGLYSAVFTFWDTDGFKSSVPRIMPETQKFEIFRSMGFDYLFICSFDDVREMSGEDFVGKVLLDKCSARFVVCGENFRFGHDRSSAADALGKALGADRVIVCEEERQNGVCISSTLIRSLIQNGELERANAMLGSPYSLEGEVLHGKELGRRLDAPTLNQQFFDRSVLPKAGVYATRAVVSGHSYPAVTNVGTRPTVDGHGINAETHIIGFDGDLYGHNVRIEFLKYLRGERKFLSIDALKAQIHRDIGDAIEYERSME